MEKSNLDKIKDALLYAPVGAFGFLRDGTSQDSDPQLLHT